MSRRPDRIPIRAWLAIAAASLAGCGGGTPPAPSSAEEATVTGVVKAEGRPLAQGRVVFDPSNTNRKDASARSTPIGKDGTYTVTTLVGQNRVRVTGLPSQANRSYEEARFEVKSGSNPYDIDLVPTQPRRSR